MQLKNTSFSFFIFGNPLRFVPEPNLRRKLHEFHGALNIFNERICRPFRRHNNSQSELIVKRITAANGGCCTACIISVADMETDLEGMQLSNFDDNATEEDLGLPPPPTVSMVSPDKRKNSNTDPPRSPMTPQTPSDTARLQKEASRLAKVQNTCEKATKVAVLKEKWAKEKEAKLISMNERRDALQKFIIEASEKEAEIRKMRSAMRRDDERRKHEKEQDLFESAALDRAHSAASIDKSEKERRKHSVMLNKEMMRQFKEKEAEIEICMKVEEAEVLAARRQDFINARDLKYAEEDRKRESLFAKGKVAQEHRVMDVEDDKVKLEVRNDIIDFRRSQSMARAEQEREDEQNRRDELIFRNKEAQLHRNLNELMMKAKHDEEVDVLNFRRELALHRAAKEREDEAIRRQALIQNGEVAQEDRRKDMLEEKARQDEERDVLNFRHEIALHKSLRETELKAERRQSLIARGEAAQEDRRTDGIRTGGHKNRRPDEHLYRRAKDQNGRNTG